MAPVGQAAVHSECAVMEGRGTRAAATSEAVTPSTDEYPKREVANGGSGGGAASASDATEATTTRHNSLEKLWEKPTVFNSADYKMDS